MFFKESDGAPRAHETLGIQTVSWAIFLIYVWTCKSLLSL